MLVAAVLKGITLGLMLSISVGPVIFSIIKQSINNGHKGGFAFIAGVSASDISLVVASVLFTTLIDNLIEYKTIIGVTGSCLLIALGIYVTFFKKVKVSETGLQVISIETHQYVKIFFSGFLMNMLNPSVIGFWLLTSTSLLVETRTYRFIVYLTCLVIVLGFDVLKVMLAGKIRQKLTPHNIHIINRISGLILIGFGMALIWGVLAYGDKIH